MLTLNFSPFPTLTTQRLVLRRPQLSDDNETFALRSDRELNRYVDRPLAQSIDDARQFLQKLIDGIDRNEQIAWAINLKDENKLLGSVCLWNIDKEHAAAEIGFELSPAYHRRGIVREAVENVLEYGFNVMNLAAVSGWVHSGNERSIKVMKHFGFARDHEAERRHAGNDYFKDTIIYTLHRKQ